MYPFFKNVGGFLHKNRNKIVVASIIAISVAAYVHYSSSNETEQSKLVLNLDESNDNADLDNKSEEDSRHASMNHQMSPGNRSRILLRIRRQFDITAQHFMPTLRIKIIEVVDINGTVRQIKELRSKSNENSKLLETQLWEEIKISSFTMLFVSAYMLSAICVLLRIQLHILARTTYFASNKISSQFVANNEMQLDSEMFKALIDATYKHMFGSGLRAFAALVKHRVSQDLRHWTVQEKLSVQFGDLLETVSLVRRSIETDLPAIVQTIFIPPSAHTHHSGNTSPSGSDESFGLPHDHGSSPTVSAQKLLDQTWDLLESPMFAEVYAESLDAAFRVVFEHLRRSTFMSETPSSSGAAALKSLPLASLLPQIKAVAARLLPSTMDSGVTAEMRDISSGPNLDAFCLAVLDAPLSEDR